MKFVEEPHSTWFNGRRVFGVSEILNKCGLVETWDGQPGFAAWRGTCVHEAVALYLRGELDEDSIDPAIEGHFDAAKAAIEELRMRPAYVEQTVVCSRSNVIYGGNLDFFGEVAKKPGLVDWKNGSPGYDRYTAQLGGYFCALEWTLYQAVLEQGKEFSRDTKARNIVQNLDVGLYIIVLQQNGRYKLIEKDKKECLSLWSRCFDEFLQKGTGQ